MITQTDNNHKFETRQTYFVAVGQLLSIRFFPTISFGYRRRPPMSPITARKLEGQLLCVALFRGLLYTQNAKVTLLIFSLLGDMSDRLLYVDHGT